MTSCKDTSNDIIEPDLAEKRTFVFPQVMQDNKDYSASTINAESMPSAYMQVLGKCAFTKWLEFSGHSAPLSFNKSDFARSCHVYDGDSAIQSDGFQLKADYSTTLTLKDRKSDSTYCYFPLYLINETSETKLFYGKDSYVPGIMEAVDTAEYNHWHPIEYRTLDWCGNGWYAIKVNPGEFVMMLAPKYEGDTKGKMRVRMQIDSYVYISNVFEGYFNQSQFIIPEFYMAPGPDLTPCEIARSFFGSHPKGVPVY